MISLTAKIANNSKYNTPNVICRGTDTLTYRRIFSPDSGISSHSFGSSYMSLFQSNQLFIHSVSFLTMGKIVIAILLCFQNVTGVHTLVGKFEFNTIYYRIKYFRILESLAKYDFIHQSSMCWQLLLTPEDGNMPYPQLTQRKHLL